MFRLDNKVTLVTGAARGIGRSIAFTLANQGARVALVDILFDEVTSVATVIGGEARAYEADLSRVDVIDKLVATVASDFGTIDILVNNAGICRRLPFADSSEADWDKLVSVNAKSQYFMMQAVRPIMKAQGGGRIVNMASSGGRVGSFDSASIYSGTKGAVIMFSKSVAREVADDGILINCVAPGCIATELITSLPTERIQSICDKIPLKRLGKPEEVAAVVAFLAAEEASYMTGAVVDVTGGWVMP